MRSIPRPLTRVLLAVATLIVAASTSDSQAVRRTIEGRVFNSDRTPAPNAGVTPDRLYDPKFSIRLGAEYWSELMSEFQLPEMALTAYNGGPCERPPMAR
jgi:hypothetical protein